eukprot:scaffold60127_cov55-Attheya_sp.AAC.6
MDEMLKSFESHFNDMQECMDASHKDLRSLSIVTMQQIMYNMMEKNSNMENATGTTRGASVTSENISTHSDGSKRDDKVSTLHAVATN